MTESSRLVDLVGDRIERFLAARTSILASIADDVTPLSDFSRQFLSGGKRFRAQFCFWGWEAIAGTRRPADDSDVESVIGAAAALELFHAAALVHDDIIDRSDTRRGGPSAHRRFESLHEESGFVGDAADFGEASAILYGDLLLGFSDELLDESLEAIDRGRAAHARRVFNGMRTEVIAGQYLDILEERAWRVNPESDSLPRAQRVLVYKSAKYSVQAPLTVGAALAGATPGQTETLATFGLPLGIAYQLRDDMLGVFGDAELTGKPSGDDLREGKRTVLIALARKRLPASARRLLDELLGDPGLDEAQIRMLQTTIRQSGATDEVESMIDQHVKRANAALDEASLSQTAVAHLRTMTRTVTDRAA